MLYVDDFTALFLVCVCVCVCIVLRLYVKYPTAILPFMNACCAYVDDFTALFLVCVCVCVRVNSTSFVCGIPHSNSSFYECVLCVGG